MKASPPAHPKISFSLPPRKRIAPFLGLILTLLPSLAQAGVEQLSEKEFRALAAELSPKVTLFQAIWREDKKAEFYGGTSRDFLYWIKGKFQNANNPAEARAIAEKLKAMPMIDARSFIIGDSDIDVVSAQSLTTKAETFGVRKIDSQPADIFDPASDAGFNELNQGHAPAEKIRLGRTGIVPNPGLGDGAAEIYSGKLTVHFADPKLFSQTKFAQAGINHPVLLGLRYIRLQAMNYFHAHGGDYPDTKVLFEGMDEASAKEVKKILQEAIDGDLTPYFAKTKFKSWVNGAIQKAFRSYTNPTAAHLLMKHFGVDDFVRRYSTHVEPINQYVFAKHRDPALIAENFRKAGVDPKDIFLSPKTQFPDGFLYHGTTTEEAFRGIIFQGVLPSEGGSASGGLYGVPAEAKAFSEEWAGDKNRLIKFPVKPDAKIIDITQGPGEALWRTWPDHRDYDGFAEAYGADFLRYHYGNTKAFILKNSGAIGHGAGVYREILPLDQLVDKAKQIRDAKTLMALLSHNSLTPEEGNIVVKHSGVPAEAFRSLLNTSPSLVILKALALYHLGGSVDRLVEANIQDPRRFLQVLEDGNFTFEQGAEARARMKMPDSAFDELFQVSQREEPDLAKQLVRYVVPGSHEPRNVKYVNSLIKTFNSEADTTVDCLVHVLSRPGWEAESDALLKTLVKFADTTRSVVFLRLADLGYWDRRPEILHSFLDRTTLGTLNDLQVYYFGDNHRYPGAWKKHLAEFPFLFNKAFSGQAEPNNKILWQLKVAMNLPDFADQPELFLELNRAMHRKGTLRYWRLLQQHSLQNEKTAWFEHPYFKELTHGTFKSEDLLAAWESERIKPEVQTKLRALGMPADEVKPLTPHPLDPALSCEKKFGGLP